MGLSLFLQTQPITLVPKTGFYSFIKNGARPDRSHAAISACSIFNDSDLLRELQCSLCIELCTEFNELIECNALELLVRASDIDRYCILSSFLIAYNEDIRILHLLESLDLVSHVNVC